MQEDFSQYIEVLQDLVTRFGLNLIAAIVIFLIGQWIAKRVRWLVRRLMSKGNMDPTLISFVSMLTYYLILAFVVIASLNRLGIQTASLIAVVGAAGLAVGLALQGSLSNFAAGVLIIIFRPFNVGDLIEAADVLGTVEEIQLFTTALITLDNKRVTVPNASLIGGNITNYTVTGKLRVDTVIGVAYDADIDRVKQVISEVLSSDPLVLQEPAPTIAVMELADSSVNFAVRPWAQPENYWSVYFNTYENVKKRLDAEGITIPFPQRDIHVFQNN
ncbi:MAG: mechanosensitive ion channel [Leptolyngbya sp. SIO1E4]|nr:mechanosensitive ion channel [Leptolyngbya sp. SIO1E4]